VWIWDGSSAPQRIAALTDWGEGSVSRVGGLLERGSEVLVGGELYPGESSRVEMDAVADSRNFLRLVKP
jgi:hypothetical protein